MPGHELVGTVTSVGADVKGFAVGDKVGVGWCVPRAAAACAALRPAPGRARIAPRALHHPRRLTPPPARALPLPRSMVDSCGSCKRCGEGRQQFCGGMRLTYNSKLPSGELTFGGYSSNMVVDQRFVLRMPAALPLDAAAPLLCAGITTYSPLRAHGLDKPGTRLGVLGLGGLGGMAVKFGAAFGCEVTVISTSAGKEADARALGAKHFLLSPDAAAMAAAAGSLDGIIDTVSAHHDLGTYLQLLDVDGKLVLVGVPPAPLPLSSFPLIFGARSVVGSLIGGVAETQEMLDFCGQHGIVSNIEKVPITYVNEAYARLLKNDVKGRFVIDMSTLKA